jgi:hypothetical protein
MRILQALLCAGLLVSATFASAQSNGTVVATVNGVNITQQQLLQQRRLS